MSNINRIYSIAKSVQPFVKGESLEKIYQIVLQSDSLSFVKELIPNNDLPILIFTAYQISIGNDDKKIVEEIVNNLYTFTVINFSDVETKIRCENCSGNGEVSCDYCGGDGEYDCNTCNGSGEIDCNECGGDGEVEDIEGYSSSCDECNSNGKVACDDCNGDGYNRCDNCHNGYNTCDECNGNGEIECDDRIPYSIETYMSYDNELKNTILYHIEENEEIESPKYNEDKTFLLYYFEFDSNDDITEEVDIRYENSIYFGDLLNNGQYRVNKFGTSKQPLRVTNISIDLPDKFKK